MSIKSLFIILSIIALIQSQNDYDSKLHDQVEEYIKKNNFTEKATITRKEFVEMFINVISNGQSHAGAGGLFEQVANKLADKVGKETLPTKEIPSLFNLTEMTLMYAELNDDDTKEEEKGEL